MARTQSDAGALRIQATPLYSQLSTVFRDLITQEEWPKGKPLPSEAELARRFGVSVGTTRKALEALETTGWVTRKQGRGTFVTDPSERQFDRFCRIFESGTRHSVFTDCLASTLQCDTRLPTDKEASSLKIDLSEKVIHLVRRFDRHGAPFMLEKQTLQAGLLPEFEKLPKLPVNLFSIMWRQYGLVVDQCEERLQAVAAPHEVSSCLHLRPEAPVMFTERDVLDTESRVVAVIQRWFDPKGVDYVMKLV